MRLATLIIAFAFAASPARALVQAESVSIGEDDVTRLTLGQNEHVKAARAQVEAARARTGHLARSVLPTLEAAAGYEHFRTGVFAPLSQPFGEITAQVSLFPGGRDLLEDRIRDESLVRAQAESDETIQQELSKARSSYWNLVARREMIALLKDALARNDESRASAQKRVGAGMGTETDRLEFDLNQSHLEQDLTGLRIEERNNQRELVVLLGFPVGTELTTPAGSAHLHEDALIQSPFTAATHREIATIESQLRASRFDAQRERRAWTPEVTAYGGYSLFTFRDREYPAKSDRVDAVVGAKVAFRIFDGGVARSEAVSMERQAEALELRKIQSLKELEARRRGAADELVLLHEQIHGAEKNVEQANRYLKGTLSEYRHGVKNAPDVAGASLKYVEARRRWIELRRDYQLARTELMSILGK